MSYGSQSSISTYSSASDFTTSQYESEEESANVVSSGTDAASLTRSFNSTESRSTLLGHQVIDLEKSYNSDAQTSESGSDFSANVSDFGGSSASIEGDGSSQGSAESDLTEDTEGSSEESSSDSESDFSVADSSILSESVSNEAQFHSQVAEFLLQGQHPGLADDLMLTLPNQSHKPKTLQHKEDSTLIQAVKRGDSSVVRQLIRDHHNLSATDSVMRTPLHVACGLGRVDIVHLLIASGGIVDACSASGQTPLHEACIGGHYKVLKILTSEVSDLDAVDKNGMSAAHYCALNGEVNCLTLLCNQGCDICLEDNFGRTGVHLAALKDHPTIIQCLLDRGMELDTSDREGKTPAHYAARHGNLTSLKVLVKNAVDISAGDGRGVLPTHEAAHSDQLDCFKFLLKRGGKTYDRDDLGRTSLHHAAIGGGTSCLHLMLETSVLPNNTDKEGNSGLHHAAMAGQTKCFHCLLQHGADQTLLNGRGESPQDTARRHGKFNTINKAVNGMQTCNQCDELKEATLLKLHDSSKPSLVHMTLQSNKTDLFLHPLPYGRPVKGRVVTSPGKLQTKTQTLLASSSSRKPSVPIAKRTLAAKYYGPVA